MRVLIACEFSATVRDAFRARGHDAWSCDLLPTVGDPQWHIQGDVLDVLGGGFDLMVAHPPCTYLSSSGLHWNGRVDGRAKLTEDALDFVRALMAAPIPRICIENPIGKIGTAIRPADQTIQPHWFGHDASKATCLWLRGLRTLMPTGRFNGRWVRDPKTDKPVERWSNQTDGGQNKLAPSEDRWALRSETYAGIAAAMADQWGDTEFRLEAV